MLACTTDPPCCGDTCSKVSVFARFLKFSDMMTFSCWNVASMNAFASAILAVVVLVYKAMRKHVDVGKKRNVCPVIKNIFVTTNASVLNSVVVISVEKRSGNPCIIF